MPAVVDVTKCDGCCNCQTECPTNCIEMVDGKAKVNEDECIECNACQDNCPQQAIEVKN